MKVEGLETACVRLSAGGRHSVLIDVRGDIFTFGSGEYGRLGHGDVANQLTPRKVEHGLGRVVDAAAGACHTMAMTVDGRLLTFGYDGSGQLGHGAMGGNQLSPRVVESLRDTRLL